MATVAELIKKLKTLPRDAVVEVLQEYSSGYETSTSFEPVDIESINFIDFCDEKYRDSQFFGKCFVQLNAK